MSRELISNDSLISSEELLRRVGFDYSIQVADLSKGKKTKFSVSEIEAAYPLLVRSLGVEIENPEYEFDETGRASYLGTQLHEVDPVCHYLSLPIRPEIGDFFPTTPEQGLGNYSLVPSLARGYLHNYQDYLCAFLEAKQRDFDQKPHDMPLSSGFKIVDEVEQRARNKEELLETSTKLLAYWQNGGAEKLGITPQSRNYREVATILNIQELGIQSYVRLDGLILGGNYGDLVLELKTGPWQMRDEMAASVRYRQAQMLAYAAGILLKDKQKSHGLSRTGKTAVLNVKSLENSVYVFRHKPVRVLYRYFDKECGNFRYEGFEMDESQAAEFVIWLTALARFIRIDPREYKKQISKQKAIKF
jgi:hypothetical protein